MYFIIIDAFIKDFLHISNRCSLWKRFFIFLFFIEFDQIMYSTRLDYLNENFKFQKLISNF